MKESAVMLEIRRIRDENSLRHVNMTSDELDSDLKKSMEWFLAEIGKPISIISGKNT